MWYHQHHTSVATCPRRRQYVFWPWKKIKLAASVAADVERTWKTWSVSLYSFDFLTLAPRARLIARYTHTSIWARDMSNKKREANGYARATQRHSPRERTNQFSICARTLIPIRGAARRHKFASAVAGSVHFSGPDSIGARTSVNALANASPSPLCPWTQRFNTCHYPIPRWIHAACRIPFIIVRGAFFFCYPQVHWRVLFRGLSAIKWWVRVPSLDSPEDIMSHQRWGCSKLVYDCLSRAGCEEDAANNHLIWWCLNVVWSLEQTTAWVSRPKGLIAFGLIKQWGKITNNWWNFKWWNCKFAGMVQLKFVKEKLFYQIIALKIQF